MRETIYCKTTDKGIHSFYLRIDNETFYLFSQAYRRGVAGYYRKGVLLKDAMDYSKSHGDSAVKRTMTKIPLYIKYIEKEYEIEILEQTKRKNRNSRDQKRRSQLRCA